MVYTWAYENGIQIYKLIHFREILEYIYYNQVYQVKILNKVLLEGFKGLIPYKWRNLECFEKKTFFF